MIRYNQSGTPSLEAYVNGSWTALITSGGSTSTITLGTSATASNPQRSGQAGTGLFSAASNTVSIAAGGADEADFTAIGENILGTISSGSYSVGYQINGSMRFGRM